MISTPAATAAEIMTSAFVVSNSPATARISSSSAGESRTVNDLVLMSMPACYHASMLMLPRRHARGCWNYEVVAARRFARSRSRWSGVQQVVAFPTPSATDFGPGYFSARMSARMMVAFPTPSALAMVRTLSPSSRRRRISAFRSAVPLAFRWRSAGVPRKFRQQFQYLRAFRSGVTLGVPRNACGTFRGLIGRGPERMVNLDHCGRSETGAGVHLDTERVRLFFVDGFFAYS